MRVVYSGACAPALPLEEELTLAASAGYDAIEIWLPKLWPDLERRGPEGLAHLLDSDPPAVGEARIPEPGADAASWARRLRESALDVLRDPRFAPSR